MRKRFPRSYLFLIAALFLLVSLSTNLTTHLRGATVAIFSPLWQNFNTHNSDSLLEEVERLELENKLLKNQLEHRRKQYSSTLPQEAIPAQVIFRSPSSWNNSLWINVGKLDDANIVQNSPVLIGKNVVGVIDYVGNHQSRVKLLTDSGLTPSVRVARGQEQANCIAESIDQLLHNIYTYHELFEDSDTVGELVEHLEVANQNLKEEQGTWLLAKGELHGSSHSLWRTNSPILRGIGFNYDFPDKEGPARDLRSGKPEGYASLPAVPILKVKDLLVTTGMDGVFPPGLHVAEVTKILPLKEGDYYYEIEAKPTAGNLEDLSFVFVIPPAGYDKHDTAPVMGW